MHFVIYIRYNMPTCKPSYAALITSERVLSGSSAQYALAPALGANTKDLWQVVLNPQRSVADKYALVSMAAVENERYQYRRYGPVTLAMFVQNADNNGTTYSVLVQGCKDLVLNMRETVFAGEVFDSVYDQLVQLWEEKATYTFAQWKRERGTILATKGMSLEPTIELASSFTELFDREVDYGMKLLSQHWRALCALSHKYRAQHASTVMLQLVTAIKLQALQNIGGMQLVVPLAEIHELLIEKALIPQCILKSVQHVYHFNEHGNSFSHRLTPISQAHVNAALRYAGEQQCLPEFIQMPDMNRAVAGIYADPGMYGIVVSNTTLITQDVFLCLSDQLKKLNSAVLKTFGSTVTPLENADGGR